MLAPLCHVIANIDDDDDDDFIFTGYFADLPFFTASHVICVHYRNWHTRIFLRAFSMCIVINCSQVMQQRLNSVSKDDYEALYKELQVRVRVVDLPF